MGIKDSKYSQVEFHGGLNLNTKIQANELQECTNCDLSDMGKIAPTNKDSKIVSSTAIDSIAGADGNVYYNIGTALRRYVASTGANTSLGTIGSSSKLKALKWNRGYSIIMASDKLYKDIGGALSNLGTTAPTTAPTVALVAQKSLQIETFENQALWTASGLNKADDAVNFKQGTKSLKISPTAANTVGYVTKAVSIDLSQYADSTTSPDDDYISLAVFVDNPERLTYLHLIFDISAGDFKNDIYWKTIPVLPVANNQALNEESPETWDNLIRQKQNWEREWQTYRTVKGIGIARRLLPPPKITFNETTGKYSYPDGFNPNYVQREKLKQLGVIGKKLSDRASAQNDTWTIVKIRKSDFIREGVDTTKGWADVAAIKFRMLASDSGAAIEVSLDDLKMVGGGKLDNDRYSISYSYVSRYTLPDGSYYNEESGLSPEAEITGAEAQNIAVSVIADSAESQVTHKNVWIRGGGLVSRYLVGTIAQGVTTLTTDKTEVQYVTEPIEDIQFNVGQPSSAPTDIAKSNGILFVATNSRLWISDPLVPYAFAGDSFQTIQGPITGIMPKTSNLAILQAHEEKILINPGATALGGAYMHDPEYPHGCLSARSTDRGFYSTEEGIAYFAGAAPQIISDKIKKEIVGYDQSNAVGAWNKGSYFFCLPAQQVMYEFDAVANTFAKHDGIKDICATNGVLYVLKSDGIYIFEGDSTGKKAFAFRTPEVILADDDSFSAIVVDGYCGADGVTIEYYLDGVVNTTKTFTDADRKTYRVGITGQGGNRISVRISGATSADTNTAFYSISLQGGKD